jgi:hypothetical protein
VICGVEWRYCKFLPHERANIPERDNQDLDASAVLIVRYGFRTCIRTRAQPLPPAQPWLRVLRQFPHFQVRLSARFISPLGESSRTASGKSRIFALQRHVAPHAASHVEFSHPLLSLHSTVGTDGLRTPQGSHFRALPLFETS